MIKIIERTKNITLKQLCDLLFKAHQGNREKGLFYGTANITEDKLKDKLNENAHCFVALNDKQLVGCIVVSFINISKWFYKGKCGYFELIGVLPEFQGKGVVKLLYEQAKMCVMENGQDAVLSISAEKNITIKKLYLTRGFKKVAYGAGTTNNFYSVFYFLWLNQCPYSDMYISFRFFVDKLLHQLVFKPGGRYRFWI